jgi:AcrR family transcriptional regulator
VKPGKSTKQRILDAALDIVEDQGVRALTQPKIAKAAGLRQSHITYYFPRKADLLVALLAASHERALTREPADQEEADFDSALQLLKKLMLDRDRMRFFLRIVLEAGDEPALREIVSKHAGELTKQIAAQCGRSQDDPSVAAFVDFMRGVGLRKLLEPDEARDDDFDIGASAQFFGLGRPRD